jgi:hypothetical protein
VEFSCAPFQVYLAATFRSGNRPEG